ncbi:hypothetical protein IQ07DRAFT_93714 [Pyrenochaeta sp. DS3sAY3a]|nr:hypothetical protein IQ07DRAFT_93714 [Pyrenochaeta sp. DS3sAY3a]
MNQKVESQSADTVKLLEYDRQIIRSIETAQISTTSDHEAFASGLARQSQLIRRGHNEFQRQGVNLLTASHRTHETMKQFQSRTEKDFRKSRRSLDRLQNTVEELASKATFSAVTVEAATRIIREELRVNLRDILDQEQEKSQNVFEAKLRKMEAMVDQISLDIGHDFSLAREERVMDRNLDITPANQSMIAQERGSFDFRDTEYFPDVFDQSLSMEPDIVTSTYRRTWDKDWKLGHLHIEIIHITIRKGGSPHAKTHYTLKIEFRPTASLSTIPGTSLLCSTAPTRQGHYQMAPMIALLPMIHDMDNLISIVFEGDLPELKRMLANGYVHIRSQYEFGETLLYVSYNLHVLHPHFQQAFIQLFALFHMAQLRTEIIMLMSVLHFLRLLIWLKPDR